MKTKLLLIYLLTSVCTCVFADVTLVERNAALRSEVLEALLFAKDVSQQPIITSGSQMSSPYSQNDRSGIKDGGNLVDGVLIDNNLDTYWHSVWSEGSVEMGSHYVQISGTDKLLGDARLYMARRRTDSNHPTELTLKGSNNPNASASKWKTITVQQIGNVTNGGEWTTPVFNVGNTPYSYIRVYATQSTFWHCSELQIYRLDEGPNSFFSELGQAAVDLEKIYKENCATADADLTEAMYSALKSAFDVFRAYAKEKGYLAEVSQLVVNEIQTCNIDQFVDPSYNYGAWVEFYNPTHTSISLAGTYVTDDKNDPKKFAIPSSIGRIAPGDYATLWFDHNSTQGNYGGQAQNQVPFKLDSEGDTLYIFDVDGNLLLSQAYPAGIPRCSWARTTDGGEEWSMSSTPSPGKSNAGSKFAEQRLSAPVVDTDGTLFTDPFTVHVTIPQGTTLRFTTDGSTPTLTNGMTSFSGAFDISNTRILRFCLFKTGYLPSPVVTRSYIYKNHDYYLPVISVVTNPDNLYDNTIGVYTQGTNGMSGNGRGDACNWNMDWERPVNLEYLTPETNTEGAVSFLSRINQELDFEICGGWSRAYGGGTVDGKSWPMKSSFRLKTDKRYEGQNSLDYPVFPNKPYNKYKVWQVRNGGNDTYSRITDAAVGQIAIQSNYYMDAQDYQPAHVFFNGEYLGMLNIRESNNRHYGYSNYGIDTDEMDQFDLSNARYNQKVGDDVAWKQLVDLSRQLASDHSQSTYKKVCALLDIDEYCNYMAFQCYVGNTDWITNVNNVKGFRSRTEDGKFHFVLFDDDGAFGSSTMTASLLQNDYTAEVDDLFRNLMQYDPFRSQFVTAFCIVNGSVFDLDASAAIVQNIYDRTNAALRFEGNSSNTGLAGTIRNAHDGDRMNNLRSTLGLSDPYQLTISSNISQAHLSLNGQEIPRAKLSGKVFSPVTLTAKAPAGYTFQGWSLVEGSSVEEMMESPINYADTWDYYDQGSLDGQDWTAIDYNTSAWKSGRAPFGYAGNVNKFMYTSSNTILDYGPNSSNKRPTYYFRRRFYLDEAPSADALFKLNYKVDDGFRFYLNGQDIDGFRCDKGVDYSYMTGDYAGDDPNTGTITISPDALHQGWNVLAVEVHNCNAGSSDIYWDGQLASSVIHVVPGSILSKSETFCLSDIQSTGQYVVTAVYESIKDSRKLLERGATPIRINEVSAGNDIYINDYFKRKDWIELYNTTDAPVDLAGMYLSDNVGKPQKYQISAQGSEASTIVPPFGRVVVWCDGSQPLNQLHAPFKLDNADGASVLLQSEDGTWADRMDYSAQDRWQTYGRYPDGGVFESILVQPTIGKPNLLGTYDFITSGSGGWVDDAMAITLDLEKGWNWTSHNLSEAVDKSRFTSFAQCIRGVSSEIAQGADEAWQGSLTQLAPATGYKMYVREDASVSLRGYLYDVDTPVTLQQGWNWIGVPLYNATTIEASLKNYTPSEGDAIIGLQSFATYEDGAWTGTLTSLSPGQSYLMKVGRAQQFCWNSLSAAKSGKKRYAPARVDESYPWSFDMRAYPDVMSLIATLQFAGEAVENADYTLGVFSGDECRGVAQLVDGLLYLNVHGSGSEPLSFRVLDSAGQQFDANESIPFTAQTVMGSRQQPTVISVGQPDEILSLSPTGRVLSVAYYNIRGQRIAAPTEGVYIQKTTYENGRTVVKKLMK